MQHGIQRHIQKLRAQPLHRFVEVLYRDAERIVALERS